MQRSSVREKNTYFDQPSKYMYSSGDIQYNIDNMPYEAQDVGIYPNNKLGVFLRRNDFVGLAFKQRKPFLTEDIIKMQEEINKKTEKRKSKLELKHRLLQLDNLWFTEQLAEPDTILKVPVGQPKLIIKKNVSNDAPQPMNIVKKENDPKPNVMQKEIHGVLISGSVWGEIYIGDETFKDVKCFPENQCVAWDWKKTGTRHEPGIQIADLKELIDGGAEYIILSKGREEALQTHPETIEYLEGKGIPFFQLETTKAIDKYNKLVSGGLKVGGLFHSTC